MRKTTCSLKLEEWYNCRLCCLVLFFFLSLSARSLSIIFSIHSHTADEPKACHWQTSRVCAFMNTQRPHLEKQHCVLGSCLANAQLYMADTIEQRRGLDGEATWQNQFLFCGMESLFAVWFIEVPQIANPVLGCERAISYSCFLIWWFSCVCFGLIC